SLARLNAVMRAIDLSALLAAPLAAGGLMTGAGPFVAVAAMAVYCCGAYLPERALLGAAFRAAPVLGQPKVRGETAANAASDPPASPPLSPQTAADECTGLLSEYPPQAPDLNSSNSNGDGGGIGGGGGDNDMLRTRFSKGTGGTAKGATTAAVGAVSEPETTSGREHGSLDPAGDDDATPAALSSPPVDKETTNAAVVGGSSSGGFARQPPTSLSMATSAVSETGGGASSSAS
ncbi:hypothetical protein Agub_g12617, partial [Astrephomene gubernaculifera]